MSEGKEIMKFAREREEQLARMVDKVAQLVDEGEVSPLSAFTLLKRMIHHCEAALERVKQEATEEALEYQDQPFDGYTVKVVEGSARYSYKHIDEWAKKNKELKAIEASAKAAAKQHEKGITLSDEDGVVVQPAKVTYSKSYIKLEPINTKTIDK